jgi:hypothetical protein
MKRTEINGTPRINSMKPMESQRTNSISDRRPSASRIESGKANPMPKVAIKRVNVKPPQRSFST